MNSLLEIIGFVMVAWGVGFLFGHLLKTYRRFVDSV